MAIQNSVSSDPARASADAAAERAPEPHPFATFVNPHLDRELRQIKLDKRFVRGQGCLLYDAEGTEYLDFIAMFGALPFGFNPPEIWAALHQIEARGEPTFVQPSRLDAAGELARRLIELAPAGMRYVTFTNSGAEAVEAAIKLARAATGRAGVLSTARGFHGKTLGALSATGRSEYQRPFLLPFPGFEQLPYGDSAALRELLTRRGHEFAAFIVEPIQGEGGIVVPPDDYLRRVRKLCTQHGLLLIVDEIQTGLGRTGRMFACEGSGADPDVILLAKALGGGLMPIGAMLCNEKAYSEDFALKHSSTFAGNTLACRVGLQTLELLTRGDLLQRVATCGEQLKSRLLELRARYPEILLDVRGRGYMLGLELTGSQESFARRCLLGAMAEVEDLALVVCSYLLNHHHVRAMTTLNGDRVIRVEPPLIATRAECDRFVDALADTLHHVSSCNSARIVAHIVGHTAEVPALPALQPRSARYPVPRAGEGRWAFIIHPTELRSPCLYDPSLAVFSDRDLGRLLEFLQENADPAVLGATRIAAAAGGPTAYGEFYGVDFTSKDFKTQPPARVLHAIRAAVAAARDAGAKIVGLGGFTSIASRNGLALRDLGVPVTTGNGYTAVATVEATLAVAACKGIEPREATVAVLGAAGSVGRAVALLLYDQVGALTLIGSAEHREQSMAQLRALADELQAGGRRGAALHLSVDADEVLPHAAIVIAVTSSTRALIEARHLAPGAVVCDTAQPPNLCPSVSAERPDISAIAGGVIRLPGDQEVGFRFGLQPGRLFACMAETMMLALRQQYDKGSVGSTYVPEQLYLMRDLAREYGFAVETDVDAPAVLRARS